MPEVDLTFAKAGWVQPAGVLEVADNVVASWYVGIEFEAMSAAGWGCIGDDRIVQ